MNASEQLGFPAPLLGMEPVRLDILFDDDEHLVLAKPAGVLVQADSWYPRLPVLVESIRHQAQLGKPEFQRRHLPPHGLWAVTDLDPELHGAVLLTRSQERAESLRNELGSGHFLFTFTLLARSDGGVDYRECHLPLARHTRLPRILVSHNTGKKSVTRFIRDAPLGPFHLWKATTDFPRKHQILLHAFESGLPVLGDHLYARSKPVLLSALKRGYSSKLDRQERPLYEGPACYLSRMDIPGLASVQCPVPPRWNGLIRQLEKHAR